MIIPSLSSARSAGIAAQFPARSHSSHHACFQAIPSARSGFSDSLHQPVISHSDFLLDLLSLLHTKFAHV